MTALAASGLTLVFSTDDRAGFVTGQPTRKSASRPQIAMSSRLE